MTANLQKNGGGRWGQGSKVPPHLHQRSENKGQRIGQRKIAQRTEDKGLDKENRTKDKGVKMCMYCIILLPNKPQIFFSPATGCLRNVYVAL